ncbi:alpha/beta hydrolase-fold protein [Paenibacillus illinoisensis]|uniref:alpha/beta hydrolase n=1 Tax=Paenibacillus illinoisensis TaxID=59845 RepID=UPI003CF00F63
MDYNEFFSLSLARHVKFNVILPFDANLSGSQEPYKTLYFLPGYSASSTDICHSITLMEQSIYKGIAIVIPDGENSFYVDQPKRNAHYSQYIVEELVNVTRKLFPLSDNREDTFIGGISMGGYGSLILGMKYADTFSKILAMSPAVKLYKLGEANLFEKDFLDHLFENEENYMKNYDPTTLFVQAKKSNQYIPDLFLCSGRQDVLVYEQDVRFRERLQQNGISVTYKEDDGGHDPIFWNKMIGHGVDFLLKEQ